MRALANTPALHLTGDGCKITTHAISAVEVARHLKLDSGWEIEINGEQWSPGTDAWSGDPCWIPIYSKDEESIVTCRRKSLGCGSPNGSPVYSLALMQLGDLYICHDCQAESTTAFRCSDEVEAVGGWWPFGANKVWTGLPMDELVARGAHLRGSCWVNGELWMHDGPRAEPGIAALGAALTPVTVRLAAGFVPGAFWCVGSVAGFGDEDSPAVTLYAVVLPDREPNAAELARLEEARFSENDQDENGPHPVEIVFSDGIARYGVVTDYGLAMTLAEYFGAYLFAIGPMSISSLDEAGCEVESWACSWRGLSHRPEPLGIVSGEGCPCNACSYY